MSSLRVVVVAALFAAAFGVHCTGNAPPNPGGDDGDAGPDGGGVGLRDGGGSGLGDGGGDDEDAGAAAPDAGNVVDAGQAPSDAGFAADSGALVDAGFGATCAADDQCTGGTLCIFFAAPDGGVHGLCAAPSSTGDNVPGQRCATDADCDHSLCVATQCSAGCVDEGDCAALNQTCATSTVTVEGRVASLNVCVADPNLAQQICTSDPDVCASTGRVCRTVVAVDGGPRDFVCDDPPIGDGALYATCVSTSPATTASLQCASGLCDDATTGSCTAICADDADCAPGICTSLNLTDPSETRACAAECTYQQQCGAGRSCVRRGDAVDHRYEFVCDGNRGPLGAGEYIAADGGSVSDCQQSSFLVCEGGPCLSDNRYCTQLCRDANDCTAAAPDCETLAMTFPDGGTQNVNVCKRP